jgi:hypothetical protein
MRSDTSRPDRRTEPDHRSTLLATDRRRRALLPALLVAAALAAAACGSSPSATAGSSPTGSASAASPSATPSAAAMASASAQPAVSPVPLATGALEQLQAEYESVVQRVSPSVVVIETPVGLGSGIVFDTRAATS